MIIFSDKRYALFTVDDKSISYESSIGATELNTDGLVWIGNLIKIITIVNDIIGGKDNLPNQLVSSFHQRFIGCIRNVLIDQVQIQFDKQLSSDNLIQNSCS
jgi:hypothetical protein